MKITKSKVALCADIHLGVHQSSLMWHRIGIRFARWLKQTLLDQDIKDLIILGDVLDNRNEVSVTTLQAMSKFFNILEDFNIIIITGNHDCYYTRRTDVHSISVLNNWNNIEIIEKPTTVQLFNKKITFCPWSTQLGDIPKSDIIFGHFDINSFKMSGSAICKHGINTADLLAKSPLTISGHFHSKEEREYKNGKIMYVGSPYEQNWGECNDAKGIYTLDLHDSSLEFIENDATPKHKRVKLSEIIAVGKITESIKKDFNGNIVKFLIDQNIDQHVIEKLTVKLQGLKPIELKTENLLYETDMISFDETMSIEGIDIKSNIIEYINLLEEIPNPKTYIDYLVGLYDTYNKE